MLTRYLRGQIEQLPPHLNQDIIDNIDNALKRMETAVPYDVYRGTSIYEDIEKFIIYDNEGTIINVDGIIGQTISEKGFLSTSLDMDASFKNMAVNWTIEVPAGSNGALISSISVHPEEAEMLFSTGQNLFIKYAEISDGRIYIG